MRNPCIFLIVVLLVLTGCGKSEEGTAKKTGAKVGEALTDFASGVGSGIDKQMSVNAELSPAMKEKGISMTTAKSAGPGSVSKAISVYLTATKALKGRLIVKAVNEKGQEIGRSVADVDFADDDAKYVTFKFQNELDTQLVKKYLINISRSSAPAVPQSQEKDAGKATLRG